MFQGPQLVPAFPHHSRKYEKNFVFTDFLLYNRGFKHAGGSNVAREHLE